MRWPFDDFQPVGLVDLVLVSIITSMIVWPPFFGVLQILACLRGVPHPTTPGFVCGLIAMLVATGFLLGLLCSLALILGGYYRIRWLQRLGPFVVAAVLVGLESWLLPRVFTGDPGLWRSGLVRALCGAVLALLRAWCAVRIALQTARVHPYRGEMDR